VATSDILLPAALLQAAVLETTATTDALFSASTQSAAVQESAAAADHAAAVAAVFNLALSDTIVRTDVLVPAATTALTLFDTVASAENYNPRLYHYRPDRTCRRCGYAQPTRCARCRVGGALAATDTLFPILTLLSSVRARAPRPKGIVQAVLTPGNKVAVTGRTRAPQASGRALFALLPTCNR
jgi:hypothetical protein